MDLKQFVCVVKTLCCHFIHDLTIGVWCEYSGVVVIFQSCMLCISSSSNKSEYLQMKVNVNQCFSYCWFWNVLVQIFISLILKPSLPICLPYNFCASVLDIAVKLLCNLRFQFCCRLSPNKLVTGFWKWLLQWAHKFSVKIALWPHHKACLYPQAE